MVENMLAGGEEMLVLYTIPHFGHQVVLLIQSELALGEWGWVALGWVKYITSQYKQDSQVRCSQPCVQ